MHISKELTNRICIVTYTHYNNNLHYFDRYHCETLQCGHFGTQHFRYVYFELDNNDNYYVLISGHYIWGGGGGGIHMVKGALSYRYLVE